MNEFVLFILDCFTKQYERKKIIKAQDKTK